MAVSALVATAGSASANAFCTLAYATQYHTDKPLNSASSAAFLAATEADQNASILYATKQLAALYEWEGWVVTETQALPFPRSGLLYPTGYTVSSSIVPDEIQDATAEFAGSLLVVDRTADSDIEALNIRSLDVGPVSLSFGEGVRAKVIPDAARNLVPPEWGCLRSRRRLNMELIRA